MRPDRASRRAAPTGDRASSSGAFRRPPLRREHLRRSREDDEILGAARAAVVTPDPRGAGVDATQRDAGAVAAVWAHTVAGLLHVHRRHSRLDPAPERYGPW